MEKQSRVIKKHYELNKIFTKKIPGEPGDFNHTNQLTYQIMLFFLNIISRFAMFVNIQTFFFNSLFDTKTI